MGTFSKYSVNNTTMEWSPLNLFQIIFHDGVGGPWLEAVDNGDNDLSCSRGQAIGVSVALLVFLMTILGNGGFKRMNSSAHLCLCHDKDHRLDDALDDWTCGCGNRIASLSEAFEEDREGIGEDTARRFERTAGTLEHGCRSRERPRRRRNQIFSRAVQ